MYSILGGATRFMIPLLILLISTVFLVARGIKNKKIKDIELIKEVSLFTLVFGFFALFFDFFQMFEMIAMATGVSHGVLAVGLRVAVVPPIFGMIIFLIGRAGVLFITSMKKD